MSSLILWLCMISCISSLSNNDFSLSSSDRNRILDSHNDARKKVARGDLKSSYGQQPAAKSMPNMRWSDSLAKSAAVNARWLCDRCAQSKSKCNLDHECRTSDCDRGENLSAAGGESETTIGTFVSRVDSWINERRGYGYSALFKADKCSVTTCGHYVQIIWADTNKVGCAFRSGCGDLARGRGEKRSVFVCHYKEAYKWGEYPYVSAGVSSNNGDDDDDDDDDATSGGSGSDCVFIDGLRNSYKNWNGDWVKKGTANNRAAYQKGRYQVWLCYDNSYQERTYGISRDKGCRGKLYAYCTSRVKDPTDCKKWKMMTKSQDYESKSPDVSSCGAFTFEAAGNSDKTSGRTVTACIGIIAVSVIVLCGCGLILWSRRKKAVGTKEKVPDEEEESMDEEEDIEVEVECMATTPMHTGE